MHHRITIILLVILVIFSMPLYASEQEQARLQAAEDAKQDFKSFRWITTGAGCWLIGTIVGGLTAEGLDRISSGGLDDIGSIVAISCLVGISASCFPAFILSDAIPIRTLPDRLLGKSPAYIEAYTLEYTSKIKQYRRKRLIMGIPMTGVCFLGMGLIGTIVQNLSEN